MSTIKVNKLEQRSGCTATVGGGAGKTVTVDATTVTLGRCGGTVSLASGASQSGFGRTGTVDWCGTIYTNSPGTITSVNGKGYFINTTSGTVTVTLPSSPSAGDIIAVKDYARTFGTNMVVLNRNGSKMCGSCANTNLTTSGQSITLIYVDGTKGWQAINDDETSALGASYVTATGGTITTCGNFKIHTFTSSGCFQVTCAGNAGGSNKISYVVLAGGGGGGAEKGTTTSSGGGGAGGYREGKCSSDPYSASPLAATPCSALTASVATFPITVGAGGAGGPVSSPNDGDGTQGSTSTFSTISSAGGGYGSGRNSAPLAAGNGGSGGGAKQGNAAGPACGAGLGNTPPVSPPQGNNGGQSDRTGPTYLAGGGGGAGAVGGNPSTCGSTTGPGGAGVTSSITGSAVGRAGGGGAGDSSPSTGSRNAGTATDGGGTGHPGPGTDPVACGAANKGGGGGGGMGNSPTPSSSSGGGTGGSGVVILRYKFQ